VSAAQRLGQHFLTDPELLGRIADALDPTPHDVVIEIGPGRGSLTAQLAPRVARVIAIERDRRLARELRGMGNGEWGNVQIVEGDALRLTWSDLVSASTLPHSPFPIPRLSTIPHSPFPIPRFKVIGNIPYSITSPLLEKALTPPLPERIVFLVQREVAERVAAAPGGKAYGALTVGVQAVCRAELLFRVPAGAFRPPPKVESALLRLTPLVAPLIAPEDGPALRRFVTACFSRRRKQLRNVLMAAAGRSAAEVSAGLAALGLDPAARPETLPPTEFVRLLRWSGGL
jgi:16S rRNA (adenine1518-N6/adenine1519-N6)-dimethyltransferase